MANILTPDAMYHYSEFSLNVAFVVLPFVKEYPLETSTGRKSLRQVLKNPPEQLADQPHNQKINPRSTNNTYKSQL